MVRFVFVALCSMPLMLPNSATAGDFKSWISVGEKGGGELVLRKIDDNRTKVLMVTAGMEMEFGKMLMNTSSVFHKAP